jgi:tetratricopeptide (TPR) repeat protein
VIDLADTFLAMRPGDPEMLVNRGDAQFALGKRAEAQISFEAALLKRPGDPSILARVNKAKLDIAALQSRAFIASASGDLDQAIGLFDEVLKVEPDNANSLVGKSVALRRAGRIDDALACLNSVLARQAGHGGALLNKGRILEERGDLDDALEAYDKLIELNPGDADAWVAQGDVLAKMGRDEDARKSYAEALRLSPSDEDMQGKITSLEHAVAEESTLLRELFQIKGVGPAKARALRDAGFRSAGDFRKASEDDLMKVRGVTRKVAVDILKHFESGPADAR